MGKVNGKRGLKEARETGNRSDRRRDSLWDRKKRRRYDDSSLTLLQRVFYLLAVRG